MVTLPAGKQEVQRKRDRQKNGRRRKTNYLVEGSNNSIQEFVCSRSSPSCMQNQGMYICGDLHLRAHAMDRQTCTNTRTIALYSYIMYNSGSNLDIAADVTTVLFENLPLQLTQFLCTQLLGVTRELVYLHCGDVRRELLRSRQIFEMKISFFR